MTSHDFTDPRTTEHRNPRTVDIDAASSIEIVELLNSEDVPAFGSDPKVVSAIIAGGEAALTASQEGASCENRSGSVFRA